MADYAPSMSGMQTEGDFLQTPISIGFSKVLCALECAISSEIALDALPRVRASDQHAMGMIRDAEQSWQALDAALFDLKSMPLQHPDDSTFLRVAFAVDTLRTLEQNEDAAQVFAANVVASWGDVSAGAQNDRLSCGQCRLRSWTAAFFSYGRPAPFWWQRVVRNSKF